MLKAGQGVPATSLPLVPMRITRRSLLAGLAGAPLAAAEFWEKKQFPGWSEDEVRRLLTNSPWTKQRSIVLDWQERDQQAITWKDVPGTRPDMPGTTGGTIRGGSPVGGIGARKNPLPAKADVLVRWASALPIRQAKAWLRHGKAGLESAEAREALEPESTHVLEIFGLPAIVAHLGVQSLEAELTKSGYLRTKTGRTLRPVRTEGSVHGLILKMEMHFPRTEPLTEQDKGLDCYGETRLFRIDEGFDLRRMKYQGRLEI
jgi:hypothetical protein